MAILPSDARQVLADKRTHLIHVSDRATQWAMFVRRGATMQ